ncbi:MAG: hypothetical protein V2I27_04830 [Erythrobacter sp.]|jgi:hypothetical protein|nr:hypothetical protein [Erythrobacter sp.]
MDALPRRPRPVGLGRLFDWRLVHEVSPQRSPPQAVSAAAVDLVAKGLDPVLAHVSDKTLTMSFGQIAAFRIDFGSKTVTLAEMHPDVDQATIDHLVDDHVAPRVVSAHDLLVLHGSAVEIAGKLAVFIGQTGAGKSTLAASLYAEGHKLLGDDAVVIDQTNGLLTGEAVYPSLRLFRDSIERVFREEVGSSAMAFYSTKRNVAADKLDSAAMRAVPLAAIYILSRGDARVTLNRRSPADACMALVENSFALDPQDARAAVSRTARAAQVAAQVPCYELAYPHDFAGLSRVHAAILACMEQHPGEALLSRP